MVRAYERALHGGPREEVSTSSRAKTKRELNRNFVFGRTPTLSKDARLVDEADGGATVQEQLRDIIEHEHARLVDVFNEWDTDGTGFIEKPELRQALASLGYTAPISAIDELFDVLDADKSGMLDYNELRRAVSERGIAEAHERKEHAGLRERMRARSSGAHLGATPAFKAARAPRVTHTAMLPPSAQQLCRFLAKNNLQILELLNEWGVFGGKSGRSSGGRPSWNGPTLKPVEASGAMLGTLGKKELRRALNILGCQYTATEDLDAVFEMMDEDGDSRIDLGEWKRALTFIQKGKSFGERRERAPSPALDDCSGTGVAAGAGTSAAASPSEVTRGFRGVEQDEVAALETQLGLVRARAKQSARDCQTVLAEQGRMRARLHAQQAAAQEAAVVAEVVNARLQVQLAKAIALVEHREEMWAG